MVSITEAESREAIDVIETTAGLARELRARHWGSGRLRAAISSGQVQPGSGVSVGTPFPPVRRPSRARQEGRGLHQVGLVRRWAEIH
jgi:hypothetical protein